jgi:hypothetical protein
MEPRNRFQGIDSASLYSLAGRYDNPIPTRFLAPRRLYKNSNSDHMHEELMHTNCSPFRWLLSHWCGHCANLYVDPVFAKKKSPKRSFSVIENKRFGLVFAKTGPISSGTERKWTTFSIGFYLSKETP